MGKKLLMAVLSIGILTLASINEYAWPADPADIAKQKSMAHSKADYVANSDEKALDLSKPENIARLTGKWEGTWQNYRSNRYGEILQAFAFDPQDEEKPISIRTKRYPPGILGSPDSWGSSRGKIEGGKIVLRGARNNTTFRLYERTDGTLVLRGLQEGSSGENQGSETGSELYKLAEGQAYKFFPADKDRRAAAPE